MNVDAMLVSVEMVFDVVMVSRIVFNDLYTSLIQISTNVFIHHAIPMPFAQILMEISLVNVNEIILVMDSFVNQYMMKVQIRMKVIYLIQSFDL